MQRRTPGVRFNADGKAEVVLWSPSAQKVEIILLNDHKKIALNGVDFGYWELTTTAIKPGGCYKFMLDNDKELPDPASLSQPDGVHGHSQTIDLKQFNWTDGNWQNPPLDDYLIYELHTGTFSTDGTFKGIEEHLDHLLQLGITAIELMPVAQFPGGRNWGYDGVYPFAVQNSYGGAEGLMQLVNTCHNHGLAVILDVVYNHLGPEGNYFGEYGPYFTSKYCTPWGPALNFDDTWCDAVRNYFIENALMWFRDFHIDALRLDAVHAIKDFSPTHLLREMKQRANELMPETDRTHYLITEVDLNDNRFIDTLDNHGYGMDAQWIDEFHHALRVTAGGDRNGYYEDFNGIAHLAKAYEDAYVYDGQFSPTRKRYFGSSAAGFPGRQFVVFSQNHDQVGNRMLGERSSQLFSFEMQKLMAGAVLVAPFVPLLFMGEEWAAQTPFQYFVSHTEPALVEAVRKGRKAEFTAFHAEGETPDPQSEGTFNRSKLSWDELNSAHSAVMFKYYQKLIYLRKKLTTLHILNREKLKVTFSEDNKTLLLQRWHGNEKVCCAMNFSDQLQQIQLPADAQWQVKLDSADAQFGGPTASAQPQNQTLSIGPQSIVIYSN
ncbi:maltooligosyl trehalose hydrolase [Mucilaginibacter yixingensis]|uniref:Malto-oligosyltrehalose trehalohydrolase n=1 Tax=Mucilaginibacter yixingensis TaxID=1295612 RepID=A0A2T5J6L0_9SPHI|nr:malto-oligosyltrehalose trehalohydrolase [Mucilaginibacter yixingensis]PTQ94101.1 maltooligosyl trehalose hydrolase [Mucilaginibacter yixingensis]